MRPAELRALLARVRRGSVAPAAAARAIARGAARAARVRHARPPARAALGLPRGRVRPGQDARSSWSRSSGASGAPARSGARDARGRRPARAALRRGVPDGRDPRARARASCCAAARAPARRGPRAGRVRRHRRPAGGRGGAGHRARRWGAGPSWSPTSASPGSTGCSRTGESLRGARVLVVVAGLEGALPERGRRAHRPAGDRRARPASGYGAHFGGLAPLLAMLNSCAAGVTVVNVDNGFGAGYAAHLINTRPRRESQGTRCMRIAYFDCFSGISGDMCLAALVSAGWPAAELQALPARLGLEGVAIAVATARRGPFVGVARRGARRRAAAAPPPAPLEAMLDAGRARPARCASGRWRCSRGWPRPRPRCTASTVEKVHFHEVGRRRRPGRHGGHDRGPGGARGRARSTPRRCALGRGTVQLASTA